MPQLRLPGLPSGMGVPLAEDPPLTQFVISVPGWSTLAETSMLSGLSTDGLVTTMIS